MASKDIVVPPSVGDKPVVEKKPKKDGAPKKCRTCKGAKQIDCVACKGKGEQAVRSLNLLAPKRVVTCVSCNGTGRRPCKPCHGTGIA